MPYDTRTKTPYQIRLHHSKVRYAQLKDKDLLSRRPYWKFISGLTIPDFKPCHGEFDGLILRHDNAWWDSHFPPLDEECLCQVIAVKTNSG